MLCFNVASTGGHKVVESFDQLTSQFVEIVWGLPLVILLVGSGIFFTIYFRFPQIRLFKHAIDVVRGKFDDPNDPGEISHFQALTSALSATVGLGNIAGVAVALSLGGPGAIFWLWIAGFIGMTTKFTEVTLSLMHREVMPSGHVHGGPMYVIKNGLSKSFYPLGWIYAFFAVLSSFGAGNMFQSSQMASILNSTLAIPNYVTGLFFAVATGVVIIGGIKRIGKFTSTLVPVMIGIYFLGSLAIFILKIDLVPGVFMEIITGAFAGTAAVGGFAGVAVKDVIVMGVRRASFSNEAGMGSSAMAHSAAKSTPIQEGVVALLEPFLDTIVVCTLTAVALLLTGAWTQGGVAGAEMTAVAFETVLGPTGRWIVTLAVTLFAFSTMISWSYYGEKGIVFLAGEKWIPAYRYVFIAFIFLGSITQLTTVINLSDAVYGLLAIPNLLACYILLPKVKEALQKYDVKRGR